MWYNSNGLLSEYIKRNKMANNTGNKKKNNSSGKKNNYNRKSNSSKKKAPLCFITDGKNTLINMDSVMNHGRRKSEQGKRENGYSWRHGLL